MLRSLVAPIVIVLTTLTSTLVVADDRYILFGGGPAPADSQISIEQNAIWIDQALQAFGFNDSRVLFGAGTSGMPDVVAHSASAEDVARWLPLARLFGKQSAIHNQYRANNVPRSLGNTSKESVTKLLNEQIKALKPGDNLLIVYSGHGSHKPDDVSGNALRLWGETPLSVVDFADILNQSNPQASVRYVLPQCFSGAFARSIFKNPAAPNFAQVATNRCGFFAVDENTIAEGCTAGIDAGDYRDYATYFVAALAGKTRLGEGLQTNPDLDGNGAVTLSEAHAYAYTEGFSTDIPRSTSDYYLETWEPWYARWHSFVPLSADNPYWRMARRLAARLHLNGSDIHALATQTLSERQTLAQAIKKGQQHADEMHTREARLRKTLLNDFLQHWPQAGLPQSAGYAAFLHTDADAALGWIQAHPDYVKLAALQDDITKAGIDDLELRRREAQFARLARALRLATIRENFNRLASEKHKADYASLITCEAWALPRGTKGTGS